MSKMSDIQNYKLSDGNIGRKHVNLPELVEFPTEVKWNIVDEICIRKIFDYRNMIHQEQNYINSQIYLNGCDNSIVYDKYVESCAQLCLKAYEITGYLSRKFNIKGINISDDVREELDKIVNQN